MYTSLTHRAAYPGIYLSHTGWHTRVYTSQPTQGGITRVYTSQPTQGGITGFKPLRTLRYTLDYKPPSPYVHTPYIPSMMHTLYIPTVAHPYIHHCCTPRIYTTVAHPVHTPVAHPVHTPVAHPEVYPRVKPPALASQDPKVMRESACFSLPGP